METTPPRMGDGVGEVPRLAELLSSDQVGTLAPEQFRAAAKEWSLYCLDNFTGRVLERGVAVSVALAELATELESQDG